MSCFNPTKVRLKQADTYIGVDVGDRFNPTKVRLKPTIDKTSSQELEASTPRRFV